MTAFCPTELIYVTPCAFKLSLSCQTIDIYDLVVKGDLCALLAHVDVLEESTVCAVLLLLDGGSKLQQLIRNGLVRGLQNVDQSARVRLVVLGEQGDGLSSLAGTTGTADTVDVVLDGQGELSSR